MDLTGQLLIAMPGMDDPRFARSVVFICSYAPTGAMGIILNKPLKKLTLGDVLARLDINGGAGPLDARVHIGGPVETQRGFVLHLDQSRRAPEPLDIPGGYVLTATQDILKDLAAGKGPDPFVFTLGYAGWGAGQLEGEIAQNGWLTAPATQELVFRTKHGEMWESAVRSIGIDPVSLSAMAGRA